jgi:hypothetical protein
MARGRRLISRRRFVQLTGGGAIGFVPLLRLAAQAIQWTDTPLSAAGWVSFKTSVVRPADLLTMDLEFVNLERQNGTLVRTPAGQALIILTLPPQNLAEALFQEVHSDRNFENDPLPANPTDACSNCPTPPIAAFLSGPTRLVFEIDESVSEIPYTLEGILCACRTFPLRTPAGASQTLEPAQPAWNETSIELPFRLILSPESQSSWDHLTVRPEPTGRTELWHTTLIGVNHPKFDLTGCEKTLRFNFPLCSQQADDTKAEKARLSPPSRDRYLVAGFSDAGRTAVRSIPRR